MKFKLEIETDNAAFGEMDDERTAEVKRIICANVIDSGGIMFGKDYSWALFDANGNKVGRAWVEE